MSGGVDHTAQVFNHGPTKGISDSLDAMSEWVATVRAPIVPALAATADQAGRAAVRHELRLLPRRHEVDEEPHQPAVSRQPGVRDGPDRRELLRRP